MEKNTPLHLQEIIFGSSQPSISKSISKLEKEGKLKKIAQRIYTSNLKDTPESIIRRNLFTILAHLYPKALLSHRSALEFKPTPDWQIFITYKYTKKVSLPGITIRILDGLSAIDGDNILTGELYVSQLERALLENLQPSRASNLRAKTLSQNKIEERLEKIILAHGEEELNKIRDRAKSIAEQLNMPNEFRKLNKIISALLNTQTSKILRSPVAIARAFGKPFDPSRLELFQILFSELSNNEFKYLKNTHENKQIYKNISFFESYFSNYIEGTVFEIDQAKEIIENQSPIATRDEDSHDVLGTYLLVSNEKEMSIVPETPDELIKILKYRHQILLSARKGKSPGIFKDKNNFAGSTSFVEYNLVEGTLRKSFDYYSSLKHPFAKAAYIMFIISEIHPFLDGNGRMARIMMNAELVHANQPKIIIPTAYREDYLLALRNLTRQRDPVAYIRMMSKIWDYSAKIDGRSLTEMQIKLEKSNAFYEPTEKRLKFDV